MRLPVRYGMQGQVNDLVHLRLRDRRLATPTGRDLAQLGDAVERKPRTPRSDRADAEPGPLGDPRVGDPITAWDS